MVVVMNQVLRGGGATYWRPPASPNYSAVYYYCGGERERGGEEEGSILTRRHTANGRRQSSVQLYLQILNINRWKDCYVCSHMVVAAIGFRMGLLHFWHRQLDMYKMERCEMSKLDNIVANSALLIQVSRFFPEKFFRHGELSKMCYNIVAYIWLIFGVVLEINKCGFIVVYFGLSEICACTIVIKKH